MNRKMLAGVLCPALCLIAPALLAQKHPDFSGSWRFNPQKSTNVGMMAQMEITEALEQSDSALDAKGHSVYQGKGGDSRTHYDLTGKPATNESPMAGPSETVSKWDGAKLVTIWTSESAVAGGPKIVRKETRSLSPDGKTMIVESVRDSNPPVIMVFDKK